MKMKIFLNNFIEIVTKNKIQEVYFIKNSHKKTGQKTKLENQDRSSKNKNISVFVGTNPKGIETNGNSVVLNPKYGGYSEYDSVTDLVFTEDKSVKEELFTKPKKSAGLKGNENELKKLTERLQLIVEDISPDSCFGLLIWLARVSGVQIERYSDELSNLMIWKTAAESWEAGDVINGDPLSSWGPLESSLAHSYFGGVDDQSSDSEKNYYYQELVEGWKSCLLLTAKALRDNLNPFDISKLDGSYEYNRAYAYLNYEKQQYKSSLENAELLQLLIPLKGSNNKKRKKLVDTYIADENTPVGSKKVFIRSDRENSVLGNGFTFMAIHRADLEGEGTGNEVVISLEPSSGTHLKDLWIEIEKLEQEKWDSSEERPGFGWGIVKGEEKNIYWPRFDFFELTDKTFKQLKKKNKIDKKYEEIYKNEGLFLKEKDFDYVDDEKFLPSQPWYLGVPGNQGTLIAAPQTKEVKVGWKDVLDIIWELYNPLSDIKVKIKSEPAKENHDKDKSDEEDKEKIVSINNISLQNLPFETTGNGEDSDKIIVKKDISPIKKVGIIVEIPRNEKDQETMVTETFKRAIADIIKKQGDEDDSENKEERRALIEDLPDPEEYEFVNLAGGFAIIHRSGLLIMDDWQTGNLLDQDLIALKKEVNFVFDKINRIKDKEIKIEKEKKKIDEGLGKGKIKNQVKLLDNLKRVQIELQSIKADTRCQTDRCDVMNFRKALEKRWGVEGKLKEISDLTKDLESALRQYSESRTNRIINWIALYFFPASFLAQFFDFVVSAPTDTIQIKGREFSATIWGIHWIGLVIYLMIATVGIILIKLIVKKNKKIN